MKKMLKNIAALALALSVCFLTVAKCSVVQAASVNELRSKVVSVAQGEIGYYPAVDNKTKYGDWYGYQGAWCTTFSIWCFDQADRAMGTKMYKNIVPSGGSCQNMKQWFMGEGTYKNRSSGYSPQAGDMIFFDSNGDGSSEHVGIVENSDGGTVNTIEGNVAKKNGISGVARRSYSASSGSIMGYGVPNYSEYGSGDSSDPPSAGGGGGNQSTPDTAVEAYQATVNTGNLNVRNAPSTSGDVVKQIKSGTVVTVTATNGDWLKIEAGYVLGQYLTATTGSPVPPAATPKVKAVAKSVRLSAKTDQLVVGQSVVLNAEIKPEEVSGNLVFSVDNENITVDQSGNVLAVTPGEATVTVTVADTTISTKYTFYVSALVTDEATTVEETTTPDETQNQAVETATTEVETYQLSVEDIHRKNALADQATAKAKLEEQKADDKKHTVAFVGTGVGAVGIASIVPVLVKKRKNGKISEDSKN